MRSGTLTRILPLFSSSWIGFEKRWVIVVALLIASYFGAGVVTAARDMLDSTTAMLTTENQQFADQYVELVWWSF